VIQASLIHLRVPSESTAFNVDSCLRVRNLYSRAQTLPVSSRSLRLMRTLAQQDVVLVPDAVRHLP